jgi:hypothetical protein
MQKDASTNFDGKFTRDHSEYLLRGGSIILKWILEKYVMDWTDLAQDRDRWKALVNTVMNLSVPYNVEKFLRWWATDGSSRRAGFHKFSSLVL